MNSVNLLGRLTKDPDVRRGEIAVAAFTLAVNRQTKEQQADFISCKAFGKTAEFVEKYISKGRQIALMGRIQTGSYEKDGKRVYTTEVIADRIFFADSNKAESNGSAPQDDVPEGFSRLDEDIPF